MAQTVAELRTEYPELTAQMEAEIRSEIEASNAEAVKTAVQAEQDRIKEIDEVGTLFDAELVAEAKYDETPAPQKDCYILLVMHYISPSFHLYFSAIV